MAVKTEKERATILNSTFISRSNKLWPFKFCFHLFCCKPQRTKANERGKWEKTLKHTKSWYNYIRVLSLFSLAFSASCWRFLSSLSSSSLFLLRVQLDTFICLYNRDAYTDSFILRDSIFYITHYLLTHYDALCSPLSDLV